MKKIDVLADVENKTIANEATSNENEINNAEINETAVDDNLLLEHNREMKSFSKLFLVLTVVAVLAGVGTGFGSFKLFAKQSSGDINSANLQQLPVAGSVKVGDVFGSTNESFKDSAEGYLEAGGLDGEGSHKLLRPGGESQTVYLTSSITDLDELVGFEIKIWGETFKGQKAGWLMDVGRVEVLNINAESPIEE